MMKACLAVRVRIELENLITLRNGAITLGYKDFEKQVDSRSKTYGGETCVNKILEAKGLV